MFSIIEYEAVIEWKAKHPLILKCPEAIFHYLEWNDYIDDHGTWQESAEELYV